MTQRGGTRPPLSGLELSDARATGVRAAQRVEEGPTLAQAFWGAASFTPTDVERMAAGLAAPLKSLVVRLLQREPAERFQTAAELEEAMRARRAVVGPYGAAHVDASEARHLPIQHHDIRRGLMPEGFKHRGTLREGADGAGRGQCRAGALRFRRAIVDQPDRGTRNLGTRRRG